MNKKNRDTRWPGGTRRKEPWCLGNKKTETRWQQEERHILQTIQSPILAFEPPILSTPLNTNPKIHTDTQSTHNLSAKKAKMRAQNPTKGMHIYIYIYIYIHHKSRCDRLITAINRYENVQELLGNYNWWTLLKCLFDSFEVWPCQTLINILAVINININ